MSCVTASHCKTNVLFRVLAFLDNTGTQSFVLNNEVDPTGSFYNPGSVFGEGTAIAAVLAASLKALRANVHRCFTNAEEAAALLGVIGTGPVTPSVRARDWTRIASEASPPPAEDKEARAGGDAEAGGNGDVVAEALTSQCASLPVETTWSKMLCRPVSLVNYAEELESELPIHLLLRLREVLAVSGAPVHTDDVHSTSGGAALSSFSCTPLVEQILIDGLDEWLRGCSVEEVRRIVLGCGVSPALLNTAFEQPNEAAAIEGGVASTSHALPDSLVDFVVDVIFPLPAKGAASRETSASSPSSAPPTQSTELSDTLECPQDWLLLSYAKNHEIIDLGEEDDVETSSDDVEEDDASGMNPRKIPRAERLAYASPSSVDGEEASSNLGAWQAFEGDEVLTAENLDHYLREAPHRVPKEIVRQLRKPISNPAITAFELEHHYTAAELKRLLKNEVGSMTAEAASAYMGCDITASQVEEAARATRKAQFVEWVLAAHGRHA